MSFMPMQRCLGCPAFDFEAETARLRQQLNEAKAEARAMASDLAKAQEELTYIKSDGRGGYWVRLWMDRCQYAVGRGEKLMARARTWKQLAKKLYAERTWLQQEIGHLREAVLEATVPERAGNGWSLAKVHSDKRLELHREVAVLKDREITNDILRGDIARLTLALKKMQKLYHQAIGVLIGGLPLENSSQYAWFQETYRDDLKFISDTLIECGQE